MEIRQKKTYLILALATAIGLLFHGASFFNTLQDTYDIYVHMFFADHYSKSWFEPWEYRWYTGFSLTSYPPLAHQLIALLSFIGGLKFGAYLLAFGVVLLYVTGAYRFSKIFTINSESAGYAALVAVFCPSVIEALHVFGQIPTVMGLGWLLHAIPEIYLWIRWGKKRYYFTAISLLSVAVASHHVTPIFGMVFFVLPVMATAVMDGARSEVGSYYKIGFKVFFTYAIKYLKRIVIFGFSSIFVTLLVILPYWILTKNDPIAQVPIPHGSRDSFIEVFSSGLVFFIIPWGFFFFFLPFIFYRIFSKRNVFLGLSFTLLIILGTGGTTPIPKMILGENAFSILTLERFTFWATIQAIPFVGEFLWRFFEGNLYHRIVDKYSRMTFKLVVVAVIGIVFLSSGFTMNLSFFRPLQPDPIALTPITNFLQSDKHYKWRYLTLGFGDQMALLSANTNAKTIDGNYHSARRIPELTTRAIERLENSKYRGIEGIGTLQQFLTAPEVFHLKYVFSNDKFYDPLLFFTGWQRIKLLSNGIMVWERADVSPLPAVLPKKEIPLFQKIWWGIVPVSVLLIAFFFNVQLHWLHHLSGKKVKRNSYANPETIKSGFNNKLFFSIRVWVFLVIIFAALLIGKIYFLNLKQIDPERVVASYYDAIDFKKFEIAHSYLLPEQEISIDQFLLETSVTDGLVDSYGKLNHIKTEILSQSGDSATVRVDLSWVTALQEYDRTIVHQTVKRGGKWYLIKEKFESDRPTNQFFAIASNNFYNQGRRAISIEETFHEDVLDRPVTNVLEAKLVLKDGQYAVIGKLQNLDDFPADVTIKATLLAQDSSMLTSYYDKFYLKHKLLPKETSPFRIDFEAVGWADSLESLGKVFDPKVFHENTFSSVPMQFKLEVLSSVATKDLFKKLTMNEIMVESDSVKGKLFNYGNYTATITQLLLSYYDEEKELNWVDHYLVPKSVFPHKHQSFEFLPNNTENVEIIQSKAHTILVNGIDNFKISDKYKTAGAGTSLKENLINLNQNSYLTIKLNSFIGNPSEF